MARFSKIPIIDVYRAGARSGALDKFVTGSDPGAPASAGACPINWRMPKMKVPSASPIMSQSSSLWMNFTLH